MDTFQVIVTAVALFIAWWLGRWSTQGESWESATRSLNNTCNAWREIAEGWEKTANEWRQLAEKDEN